MRATQLLFQTLHTSPGAARMPGQQLLIRGSYIRPLGPHAVSLLPLGVRTRRRIEAIVLDAFAQVLSQEIQIPAHPLGVTSASTDSSDRAGVVEDPEPTALFATVRGIVQSYRQLPVWLHQLGPLQNSPARTRQEEHVADLFGLHASAQEAQTEHSTQMALMADLLRRCGMETSPALAESASAAHATTHALITPSDTGENLALRCPRCQYSAYQAAAQRRRESPPDEPQLPIETVETPDCKTIADLARYLQIPTTRTAKAVFLVAGPERRFILAVVRGDTDLDEVKLRRVLGIELVGAATEDEIRNAGIEPGYGSPVGIHDVTVVIDELVAASQNLVAGANRPGVHLRNVNAGRDYQPTITADIAHVQAGDPCPTCGQPLELQRVTEIARITAPDANTGTARDGITYLDQTGNPRPIAVTHTRIWLDRLMGAITESHRDEKGLIWPPAVAPFHVYLMTAGKPLAEVVAAAERVHAALTAAGLEVLYDDREERAGVKFNDADLLGIPVRIVIGERGLRDGVAEAKLRWRSAVQPISLDAISDYVKSVL